MSTRRGLRLCARPPARILAGLAAVCVFALAHTAAASAQPGMPWWHLNATAAPTILPTQGEAQLILSAANLGDGELDATSDPVTLTDLLPEGVTPAAVLEASATLAGSFECAIEGHLVSCTFKGRLRPFQSLLVRIAVQTHALAPGAPQSVVSVGGGQGPGGGPAPEQTLRAPLTLGETTTPFGVQAFQLAPEQQPLREGEPPGTDTQAGSHPFQFTTTLDFNQTLVDYGPGEGDGVWPSAPALPRNLHIKLPPGLIGDPDAVPACPGSQFSALTPDNEDLCPQDTAVGVALVTFYDPKALLLHRIAVPVFNLEPSAGEPARFGFEYERVPIVLKTALPAGGEYPVEVDLTDISQTVQVLSSVVTFWGVPGQQSHHSSRGWGCLDEGEQGVLACEPSSEPAPTSFLTLPTSCAASTQPTVSGESWSGGPNAPAQSFNESPASAAFPTMTGCETLAFDPSFTTGLETPFASTPTGVAGTLTFPQPGLTEPEGRAESALSDTTLTLPQGLTVNPSAANGLSACSEAQAGYTGQNPATGIYEYTSAAPACPQSSKVATLHARTPLLDEELTGSLYLAEPAPNGESAKNPFDSLIGLYVVLEAPGSGILVKLGAEVHLNEATGQEQAVFPGTPQLPFHELTLSLFGGPRAATASPSFCGSYQVAGGFAGWAGESANPLSEPPFQIVAGPEGSACPTGHLPFSPSFTAGPETPKAGALTPVVVRLGRPDGDQPLTGVSVSEPPGFAAVLANVTPCQEPPSGVEWSCGEGSRVGEARVYSGLGSEPVIVTGQAYLTSGYDGAPFGLLVRTLAQAGPFNLGWVNVRSRINVNPSTAQVTVTTDPGPRGEGVPTLLKGVPVQIKMLEVAVNRPDFTFNPTNCTPTSYTGSLSGAEGASVAVSSAFTAEDCGSLPFHPAFSASTKGQASKANGTSLTVKVASQGLGVANIAKTVVTLPKQLPSRLTTIQKACLAATFEANPASCPEGSLVGTATIHTPIFNNPLAGPAYLVSHGNAAFPDVEFVLQGEGVKIVLDGQTNIKKGVTTATFNNVPDAPFTSFETSFPTGPHSALTANVPESKKFDLCGERLVMPTLITAQNGAVVEQSTQVAIQGCAAVKSAKAKRLTLAQQLRRALKKCASKYKHAKAKRAKCERTAHARYVKLALAVCRKSHGRVRKARVACEVRARREYAAAGTAGSKRK